MNAAIELLDVRCLRTSEGAHVTDSRPASARFPKSARILKRSQFRTVYDGGLRASGRLMVVFAHATDRDHARIGITATRKVGGAVQRNRLRRRIREAFRHIRHELPPVDYVVNVKRAAVERGTSVAINEEFRRLAKRVGRECMKRAQKDEESR